MKNIQKFEDFIHNITESINNEDSYIDFSKTNLEADYNMLNQKLFHNQLNPVPLKWMKSKSKLGIMKHSYIKKGGRKVTQNINGVAISTFYKLTRQQYLDVLAHEMIHVWIAQKNIIDNNSHGHRFKAMMDDINRKFKEFNVKETEDADAYSVSTPDNKIKEMGVILINDDGKYSMAVTTEKNIENRALLDTFVNQFKSIVPQYYPRSKSVILTAYKVRIPAINSYKYKRVLNLKSLELWNMDGRESLIKQIKASSKILEVKVK